METLPAIRDIKEMAHTFVQSGFFKDAKDVAQASVKILAGQELGIPPIAAMRGIDIVDGQISIRAHLMAAMVKRSGKYDYHITTSTDERCTIRFSQNGRSLGESTFTMGDAKKAGLTNRKPWQQYPRTMLYNRALSQGARQFCPDIFLGAIYAEGEIGTQENIEVVQETPQLEESKQPEPEWNPAERKKFWAKARIAMKNSGKTEDDMREYVKNSFGLESTKELTPEQRDKILAWLSIGVPEEVEPSGYTGFDEETGEVIEEPETRLEGKSTEEDWAEVIELLSQAGLEKNDMIEYINANNGQNHINDLTDCPARFADYFRDLAKQDSAAWGKIIDDIKSQKQGELI